MDGAGLIELSDDEDVARCAIYPKVFASGVFSPEALLEAGNTDFGYSISVGSRRLLPTERDVHTYGCNVAELRRTAKSTRLGRPLARPGETDHYRGFFDINVGSVREISNDTSHYDVCVEHCPEQGQIEHCEIRLRQRDTVSTKAERGSDRTEIFAALIEILRNPTEHICDCDADIVELLAPLTLTA